MNVVLWYIHGYTISCHLYRDSTVYYVIDQRWLIAKYPLPPWHANFGLNWGGGLYA